MPPQNDLREQLRPLIVARGIRATARSAGIDHSSLVRWMKGSRDISATTLQDLINVLGLRIKIEDPPPRQQG